MRAKVPAIFRNALVDEDVPFPAGPINEESLLLVKPVL
jgi:hypothetical protein